MNVPIQNRDAVQPVNGLCVARGDGDVVENAEPHRAVGGGVMTGRARGAKGIRRVTAHHEVHDVEHAADGVQRDLSGLPADAYIAVGERPRAAGDLFEHVLHVFLPMCSPHFLERGGAWGNAETTLREPGGFEGGDERIEALRRLRVMQIGFVSLEKRVKKQRGGHQSG